MSRGCCCPSTSCWLVLYNKDERRVIRLSKSRAFRPYRGAGAVASRVSAKLSEFVEDFRKDPEHLDIIFNLSAPTKQAVQNMLSYEYALTGCDSVKVERM